MVETSVTSRYLASSGPRSSYPYSSAGLISDYWSVFWGMFIIGSSGYMLWFSGWFSQLTARAHDRSGVNETESSPPRRRAYSDMSVMTMGQNWRCIVRIAATPAALMRLCRRSATRLA